MSIGAIAFVSSVLTGQLLLAFGFINFTNDVIE